jgi:hypothetical protein
MSGIVLALAGGSFAPSVPSVIGEAFGGGYYAGQIGVSSVATHYLIVGPFASAQSILQYKTSRTNDAGATSNIDGPANSASMNDASHPAAQFCEGLSIGGFTDWYMPAKNELEVCYYNLKPTTANNSVGDGVNPNAVPARAVGYTTGNPAQTSAAAFRVTTGAEAFTATEYWNSTQESADNARIQTFYNGYQSFGYKTRAIRVRAIRRIPVV